MLAAGILANGTPQPPDFMPKTNNMHSQAYIGGLYVDWGFEHIRPWLFRVLRPWVEAAYRRIRGDYLDTNLNKHSPYHSPPQTNQLSSSDLPKPSPGLSPLSRNGLDAKPKLSPKALPHSRRFDSPGNSPSMTSQAHLLSSQAQLLSSRLTSLREDVMPVSPESLPPNTLPPFHAYGQAPLSPPSSQSSEARQFTPSQAAEGHLPLLNQITQHSRRFIDWDYCQDPDAPIATPIWDVTGRHSGIVICRGRGNTKRLAKADAAKHLVEALQARLGKKAMTTVNLSIELDGWFKEQEVSINQAFTT